MMNRNVVQDKDCFWKDILLFVTFLVLVNYIVTVICSASIHLLRLAFFKSFSVKSVIIEKRIFMRKILLPARLNMLWFFNKLF